MNRTTPHQEPQREIFMSVVTVCLNNLPGLIKTWHSVKRQQHDWEWIVIDGYSVDGTREFLENLRDERLIYVSEPDKGLYDAMNKGLDLCRGKYVVFLNAGDRFSDRFMTVVKRYAAASPESPGLIYGDAEEETPEGRLLFKKARSHAWLWYGMFTHHQSMVFKRESIGGLRYSQEYPVGADYAFTAELLRRKIRAVYLPEALCIFEQGGFSAVHFKQGERDQWRIRKNILGMSAPARLLVACLHGLMRLVKRRFPNSYKRMRFSYEK